MLSHEPTHATVPSSIVDALQLGADGPRSSSSPGPRSPSQIVLSVSSPQQLRPARYSTEERTEMTSTILYDPFRDDSDSDGDDSDYKSYSLSTVSPTSPHSSLITWLSASLSLLRCCDVIRKKRCCGCLLRFLRLGDESYFMVQERLGFMVVCQTVALSMYLYMGISHIRGGNLGSGIVRLSAFFVLSLSLLSRIVFGLPFQLYLFTISMMALLSLLTTILSDVFENGTILTGNIYVLFCFVPIILERISTFHRIFWLLMEMRIRMFGQSDC